MDGKIVWDFSDFDKLRAKIPKLSLITKDALDEWAEKVLYESQQLVPVDTGALQESGQVVKTDIIGNQMPMVEIVYDEPYALYIHEDLSLEHPNGGQAKYLEIPMTEAEPELARTIAERVVDLFMNE